MKPPKELGPTLTSMQVSVALGVPDRTVRDRLKGGWLDGFQFARHSPWMVPTGNVAEAARRAHITPDWDAVLALAEPDDLPNLPNLPTLPTEDAA